MTNWTTFNTLNEMIEAYKNIEKKYVIYSKYRDEYTKAINPKYSVTTTNQTTR